MQTPVPIVRMIEEGWNQGHLEIVDECVSKNYRRDIPGETLYGATAFKSRIETTRLAMPDFHCALGEAIVNNNTGVSRWVCEGTHQGELLGIAATGKKLRWSGVIWYELHEELVDYEWELFDQAALLTQLGAIPSF